MTSDRFDAARPVTLFVQCLVDQIYPSAGFAVLEIFNKLGIDVVCPTNQTCCGQPAYNTGYRKEATKVAKHFIRVFEQAELIVCPSGSCVDMVRNHYPELFQQGTVWRQKAEKISERIFELTEYLVDIIGVVDLRSGFEGKVTYHDSCHLKRNIGVFEQPRELIRHVSGAEFVEMKNPDGCCGFGGTFSIKYPEISTAILEEKVDNIVNSGADAVVGCDMGCLMNIQGLISRKNLSIKTLHIAQLLAG